MTDPATMKGVGLFTIGETRVPVPVAGVSIEADIRGFYAKVVVTHRYVNKETTPIEVVYVFPLDESAAVCGFEAIVDGTLVIGEIMERDKAFELYNEAMEQGHGGYLLDEERPDVFQASIGNLPPGKEVLVKLTYVRELGVDEGHLRFAIPTTVSPRYAPADDRIGIGRPDSEALNPPVAWDVPYGLNLSIRLEMPGAISRIESPSHPISVAMNGCEATVALAQREVPLDRDFVLTIDAAGFDAPHALVERDEDGTEVVGVAFAPSFMTTSAPAEVIFLIDRSGSMEGTSIEEARNALQLCLRSMLPGCRFNIVGFGSSYEALFSESRPYEQATMEYASAEVAKMNANLGGTDLLPALEFVLGQKRTSELPREVVVLTDGEVTNTDAVMALGSSHASDARIFTFGIGAGASHHLVRGLARSGGGSAEFIYPGERIEPKVLRQFARLLSPALTDVRVEWTGGTVTQSPLTIPPVFAGGRLLTYGFVKNRRPIHARLSAKTPSGPVSFDVPLEHVVSGPGRTVSTLAARARIRELEEGSEWLNARGSRQKERKETSARKEIIALSTRYGLMSRETSFVAIERRETPVFGDVKLRKVPVALTTGWGGLEQMARGGVRSMVPLGPATPSRLPVAFQLDDTIGFSARVPDTQELRGSGRDFDSVAYRLAAPVRAFRRAHHRHAAPSGMQALIMLQAADGTWELTEDLAAVLGRTRGELTSAVAGAKGDSGDVFRAWATALAIAWLERNAADAQDEWRMLADKGRSWIDRASAVPPGNGTWLDAARTLIAS